MRERGSTFFWGDEFIESPDLRLEMGMNKFYFCSVLGDSSVFATRFCCFRMTGSGMLYDVRLDSIGFGFPGRFVVGFRISAFDLFCSGNLIYSSSL